MSETLFGDVAVRRLAIGGHENNASGQDEWLTPPEITDALAPFDLDPCAPLRRPWQTAAQHYTVEDNGLVKPWHGLVWCNPPYSTADKWLSRLASHGDGIALLFARTDTDSFHTYVWPHASLLLFIRGRLRFHLSDGRRSKDNAGAPSVLVAYGTRAAHRLNASGLPGQLVVTRVRGGDRR